MVAWCAPKKETEKKKTCGTQFVYNHCALQAFSLDHTQESSALAGKKKRDRNFLS